MYIDTHAHVNFSVFKNDADEVIKLALAKETWLILVGSEYKTSKRALDLANRYEKGVYSAVGLHPIHVSKEFNSKNPGELKGDFHDSDSQAHSAGTKTGRIEKFNYEVYEKLAQFEKTVAIGEIGLDYYHINYDENTAAIKTKQKEVFSEQLKLAHSLNLPAIIHCRQAHDDVIDILKEFKKKHKDKSQSSKPWGVLHCFSGDEDLAWQYFSLGLLISFTGIITFSAQWDDLIRKAPIEKIMIETDCPYMTPEPYRDKRNEPALVKHVAKRIAEIKNLSIDKVASMTGQNAKELFNI